MGKHFWVGLAFVLISCLATGCGGRHSSSPGAPSPPATQPQPPAQPNWLEYSSQEGRFKVLMPAQPTVETKIPPGGQGQGAIHKAFVFRDNKRELFQVLYLDFPETSVSNLGPDKLVDILASGVASDAKGTIQERRMVALGEAPGAEVKVSVPNTGVITARVFLSGGRGYQVIVAMPSAKASSGDVQRFLDSFQLLK
jgi:hypothetical protein